MVGRRKKFIFGIVLKFLACVIRRSLFSVFQYVILSAERLFQRGVQGMSPTICVIGVYFGKLPVYFPIWLKSAGYNESISFLIITDQTLTGLPENVSTVKMTLAEFKHLAEEKLGFSIVLERPYKCCDFKPAYGLILADYIVKYEYWAHCDFDMVFGDIRSFFDEFSLDRYDKVLDLGHLSFYRNTMENNTRFMLPGSECGDYREVFTSRDSFAFDEWRGVYAIYQKHGFSMFDTKIYADISKMHKRFTLTRKDDNYVNQVFVWEKGKVKRYYLQQQTIQNDEYMYMHFKERGALPYEAECQKAEGFFVTNKGFLAMNKSRDIVGVMKRYNRYPGRIYENIEEFKYRAEYILFRIRRRLGIVKLR